MKQLRFDYQGGNHWIVRAGPYTIGEALRGDRGLVFTPTREFANEVSPYTTGSTRALEKRLLKEIAND